jgi:hypothetical protein
MDQKTLIKTRDGAIARFQNVYEVSKALAAQFKTHSIGIPAFKEIVNDNKVEAGENAILLAFNESLSVIEKHCINSAVKMESKTIPLSIIKEAIDVSVKSMTAAFEVDPPKKKYVRKSASAKSKKAPVKKVTAKKGKK